MNLEQAASSLLEQFPNNERYDLQQEEKRLQRFGQVAFTGFGIVIGIAVLAMIYFIFTKMILSGEQPLSGILLIAFIVFAVLSLGYVVWQESLKERRQKVEIGPGRILPPQQVDANQLAEKDFTGVPGSIVESTTDLLPAKARTKKLDQ